MVLSRLPCLGGGSSAFLSSRRRGSGDGMVRFGLGWAGRLGWHAWAVSKGRCVLKDLAKSHVDIVV